MSRPTWNEYYKQLTLLAASRSVCSRLKVGCILVKNNRIVSQGYNGHLPGCEHKQIMRDGHEIATVHAEQNAITDCAKRGVSCDECIAYITHYPCIHCMKMLCAAGIRTINYIDDYHNDDTVSYFAEEASIAINKI